MQQVKTGRLGKDFLPRVLSALVLAPLTLLILWRGGVALLALVAVVLSIGLHEWVTMSRSAPKLAALGFPYLALSFFALWMLQQEGQGRDLTLYVVLSVWAVDIGAYFAGRLIGGKKLAPKWSPNKTWAGLFGGMAAASLIGYGWAVFAGAQMPLLALPLGCIIGVVAQIGDIGESAMKRRFGVKDSGTLIPGHGGVLDRIDGLLLVLPVFVLFQVTWGRSLGWW